MFSLLIIKQTVIVTLTCKISKIEKLISIKLYNQISSRHKLFLNTCKLLTYENNQKGI